jgi:hypothetical protein
MNFDTNLKNCQIKDSSWSVSYGLCIWGLSNGEEISFGATTSSNKAKNRVLAWFKQFLP